MPTCDDCAPWLPASVTLVESLAKFRVELREKVGCFSVNAGGSGELRTVSR